MIYLLLILAGISKAFMDKLAAPDHFTGTWLYKYRSPWLNDKLTTAKNKYKQGQPGLGPAFPFSTTALVFITDAWHFAQEVFLSSLILSLSICLDFVSIHRPITNELIEFLLLKAMLTGSFYIVYTFILPKTETNGN